MTKTGYLLTVKEARALKRLLYHVVLEAYYADAKINSKEMALLHRIKEFLPYPANQEME